VEPVFIEPPAAPQPGPDVRLYYSPQLLETLLQLPDGWHVSSLIARHDGVYVVDAVLPEGPTTEHPLPLVARYVRCSGPDGQDGLALSSIDFA